MKSSALPRKNAVEWTVFGVGLVVIGVVVGLLLRVASAEQDPVVRLAVGIGPSMVRDSPAIGKEGMLPARFVVPVTVRNHGGSPASGVRVEVVLTAGGETEKAGFDLAHVPARSSRRGEVVFSRDPAAGQLRASASGYETR